jgi:hypothetical protein
MTKRIELTEKDLISIIETDYGFRRYTWKSNSHSDWENITDWNILENIYKCDCGDAYFNGHGHDCKHIKLLKLLNKKDHS